MATDATDVDALLGLIQKLSDGGYRSLSADASGPLADALRGLAGKLERHSATLLKDAVNISVFMTETVTQAVQTMRSIREMSQRMTTISSATEELVSTVQAISRTSELAASNAQHVQTMSDAGAQETEQVVRTMRSIVETVQDAAERVTRLEESSASIEASVVEIERIARHTNILALNATIEAARAGDAGKGFAVVANEVKHLANQTATTTQGIRTRIDGLRQELSAIQNGMRDGSDRVQDGEQVVLASVDKMRTVSQEIRDVTTLMQDIAQHLGQQRLSAQEIASNLEASAERSKRDTDAVNKMIDISMSASTGQTKLLDDLNRVEVKNATILLAKGDHMVWRCRLAEMLVERAVLNPEELASHTQCRLGKWCGSVTDPAVLQDPAFKAMEAPHKRVHDMGIEAARKFRDGKFDEAVDLVAAIEGPSAEVQRLLDELASRHC